MVGDYLGAAQVQEGALGIYKAIRDLAGQAMSLCELGALHRQTEDVGRAEELLEQARGIFEELGDVADVLNELGTLHRVRGDLGRAEACHRQALKMARDVESQLDEARALAGLGLCALAAGHAADALAMLAEAHSIFGRMGVAETSAISALLNDIAETGTKEKRLTKGWDGRSGGRLPTISARGACEACRAPLTEVFASARAGSSASLATGS
jgi:tetratricopeptide (TPR) repeat protein